MQLGCPRRQAIPLVREQNRRCKLLLDDQEIFRDLLPWVEDEAMVLGRPAEVNWS